MPRFHDIQPSFSSGELSPRLSARLDFNKYGFGLETCENLLPLVEGGLMRRSGSRYVAELKDSSVKGRLKRFRFSTTQAYILEMGEQSMRFHRHQGQITVANTNASVTNGTFDSNITGWDNRSTGAGSIRYAISPDIPNSLELDPGGTGASDIGWAEQDIVTANTGQEHVIKFRVRGRRLATLQFQVGSTSSGSEILSPVERGVGYHCVAFTPTSSPFYIQFRMLGEDHGNTHMGVDDISIIDGAPLEIDTPWPESALFDVEGPQSADVLYLFHGSYETHKLERFGNTTWSLSRVDWFDGPYLDKNTTSTTLSPSAINGLLSITASSVNGINGGAGFLSTDVGRSIRISNPATGEEWGFAHITEVNSTTSVDAIVGADFAQASVASTEWQLGAWSATTGYPQVATFFEQRLYVANTSNQPQTFWGSQTADFESFRPDDITGTVEADDALNFDLRADDVNAIRWMSSGDDALVIGTEGGEWIPTSSGIVLTPLDITVRRQTTYGSANIQPVRIGGAVLFVQSALRKIREFAFSFDASSTSVSRYSAADITRLAEHITKGGVVEMDYAEERESILYMARNDGQLVSLTYRREEDAIGLGRQMLGGAFDTSISKVWNVDVSGSIVDQTEVANSGTNNWSLFPTLQSVGDYALFGFTEPFTRIVFDYASGSAGVGGEVEWEYWDGNSWESLPNVTDNTAGFTASVADNISVTWDEPTNWQQTIFNSGQSLYYIRARITTNYTIRPILDQGRVSAPMGIVESVAVIPGDDGAGQLQDSTDRDEVWIIVKRTINGATKRYVEFFEYDFETGDDPGDAYYSDSLITYNGVATTTITGLDHLEGETVKILADGAIVPEKTVSSGQITLDNSASKVHIGLAYKHKLKTLKVKAGNPVGTPIGRPKRIYGLTFVLLNSHTFKYGPSPADLIDVDFRQVSHFTGTPVPPFTGEHFAEFNGDWGTDPRICVESDEPVPFTLLALVPETDLNPLK